MAQLKTTWAWSFALIVTCSCMAAPRKDVRGHGRASSSGRAGTTSPNQVGGHAMVLEAGTGTFSPLRADWPQYQQNARRTGVYPGP